MADHRERDDRAAGGTGRGRAGAPDSPQQTSRLVVFTDLDGTLLAHEDYDWSPARLTLERLGRRGVPVVIASSKTRAEIEAWRRRLGLGGPFISENGGALFVPQGREELAVEGAAPFEGYLRVEFGAPHSRLRRALAEISQRSGVRLRGFGDMSREEIARRTGLSGEDLELAARREYDEPFVLEVEPDGEKVARIESEAAALGLRVTAGGRFFHLLGASSKGLAARRLIAAYGARGEQVVSVALGDGPNDLELLAAVDRPIVVARPDGTHAPELRGGVPHARFTRGAGPHGFAEGLLDYLERPR